MEAKSNFTGNNLTLYRPLHRFVLGYIPVVDKLEKKCLFCGNMNNAMVE